MHGHGDVLNVAEGLPVPTVDIEVLKDPMSGWNLRVDTTNFEIVPENASTDHVDGEGHMHLYVNGEKITRLYSSWYHLGELKPGEHEVVVNLSSNDHAIMAVDGDVIDARVTVVVPDSKSDEGHPKSDEGHHGHGDHAAAGEPNRYDADVVDAAQTIVVEIAEGDVVGGYQRAKVALNSVVALHVTADVADDVHVHSYDVLHPVTPGNSAHFAFTAEISGVFEVELEESGLLLLMLEVS